MADAASVWTKEQWVARLHAWAVERWGQARADAIRAEIDATAQHLMQVAAYPLQMEQEPGFYFEGFEARR